jgi:CheY-like chemotaxis protein
MTGASESESSVLIVEDDAATRDALSIILEDEGFRVTTAANGREAIDLLQGSYRPNVILLDLMMPVMDGWQFRAAQKQLPAAESIPVVVLSADGNIRQKASAIGAANYLQKPVEIDDLLQALQGCIGEGDHQGRPGGQDPRA